MSTHLGDRYGMYDESAPFAPQITVTSTPPNPADASSASCAERFGLSTALLSHHQRVHGLASRVMAGQSSGAMCGGALWPFARAAPSESSAMAATPPDEVRPRTLI